MKGLISNIITDKIINWCDYTTDKDIESLYSLITEISMFSTFTKLSISKEELTKYFSDKVIDYYSIRDFVNNKLENKEEN